MGSTVAARERTNGLAVRTAIRTVEIALDGDYDGWTATLRANPPMRILEELRSGETDRYRAGLAEVILEWNFVDDDGVPLPLPRDGLDWNALPYDLEPILVQRYGAVLAARTAVPKGTSTESAPTSPSAD